jgi:hypothetical protein
VTNLKVVWQTQNQAIPNAASFTKFRVKVGSVASIVLPITEREVEFQDIAPGTYTVTVELISEDETQVGGVASVEAIVPSTVPVPSVVTVTINVA